MRTIKWHLDHLCDYVSDKETFRFSMLNFKSLLIDFCKFCYHGTKKQTYSSIEATVMLQCNI